MKKKFLGMLIAVMMIGTVVGCGNTENTDASTTTDATETVIGTKEIDKNLCSSVAIYVREARTTPGVGEYSPEAGSVLTFSFDGENLIISNNNGTSLDSRWTDFVINRLKKVGEDFGTECIKGYVGDITVTIDSQKTIATYADITIEL